MGEANRDPAPQRKARHLGRVKSNRLHPVSVIPGGGTLRSTMILALGTQPSQVAISQPRASSLSESEFPQLVGAGNPGPPRKRKLSV